MKKFFSIIKEKLFTRVEKQHSEAYLRRISFLNKYSVDILWDRIYGGGSFPKEFSLGMFLRWDAYRCIFL